MESVSDSEVEDDIDAKMLPELETKLNLGQGLSLNSNSTGSSLQFDSCRLGYGEMMSDSPPDIDQTQTFK